jgi:predicted O-methyltransferase YrrM
LKQRSDTLLRPVQAEYLERLLPRRDELFGEMEELARRDGVPISDPEIGRLLEILVRARGARRVLEIGTAIGYGAIALARGGDAVEVTTVEADPERAGQARGFIERAGLGGRIRVVEGEALRVVPGLEGPFDLLYLDAVKTEYRRLLDLALPKLAVGGLVVADNALWKGMVADREARSSADDEETAGALEVFNGYLMMHPQLRALVLPIGDGLALAVKTRPLMTEMGGPW